MRLFYTITFKLCFFAVTLTAQPTNNTCETPISVPQEGNWCSDVGEFSNDGATPSGYDAATCFSEASNDVWFEFVPIATDVTITIVGATQQGRGGTLRAPEVALYFGDCGGVINQEQCASDTRGNNVIELYKGGLAVGERYFIRVQGRNGNTGTFQICINNYNPPTEPGSDCNIASLLCDKSGFVVQQVSGAGNDPTEANDADCLNGFPGNVESNSTWYSWTAATDGTLTFTLTPLNPSDDLDFVVYELPEGAQNCDDKRVIRCMASGDFSFPSPCMGPTGLAENSTDNSEPPGCNDPRQDNFLAPIQMEAGRSYALMINNFSATGNGFSIEFGGSGEFLGPQADFVIEDADATVCVGEEVSFTDASNFDLGTITTWDWNFGPTANLTNSNEQDPQAISFNRAGTKSIVLSVTSDRGCTVTEIKTITVECCGDHFDVNGNVSNLTCPDADDGAIDVTVTNDYAPYTFAWSTNEATEDISGLAVDTYLVTITDQATCDTVVSFDVEAPPPFDVDTLITMPTCGGGTDGAVTLNLSGGTEPYEFNWQNTGFAPNNSLTDIPRGDYEVVVRDGNNCEIPMVIPVRELELVLDPSVQAIVQPSCNGFSDGEIEVIVANGLGPYEYNWNDGQGFRDANSLTGLSAGLYNVQVRDANLCEGNFEFNMEDHPPLALEFDAMNASCNGVSDGSIGANVTGGFGRYSYTWSNGETKDSILDISAGDYAITVLDENQCEITGEITITEPEAVSIAVADLQNLICNGDPTGSVTLAGSGGTEPYVFAIDDRAFQPAETFTNLPAGTYNFTIEDAQGCRDAVQASITQPPALTVEAGPDQTVELGYSVNLSALANEAGVAFSWTPPDGLSCTDCPSPSVMPAVPTVYTVQVINGDNCTATDSLSINVTVNRPLYIPTAFSPNGDGFNDNFTVFGGPGARVIRTLRVFDRWGNLVFEAQNVPLGQEQYGWDGRFNGEPLSPGVFTYLAEVEFIDDVVVLEEGDVTIVR